MDIEANIHVLKIFILYSLNIHPSIQVILDRIFGGF